MTDLEFASQFVSLIRVFDSPEQAIKAVQAMPVPYKHKKIKKQVKKLIRTYAYIHKQA